MQKAMVFIDFENFDIAKVNLYRDMNSKAIASGNPAIPQIKLDYNKIPREIVSMLPTPHVLVKTFLFAPKPDDFLMKDTRRSSTYNWINGMKNQDFFTVIEGTHRAKPVAGFDYTTMDILNPASYYVEEKGTDVNLAAHLITKGFLNAYDTAIIVSGDTDYIPVIDILNTMGKTVVMVGVNGQKLHSFKHHSDLQLILNDAFFNRCKR